MLCRVHGSTDRVVGELRTLTSHAGLLPHHPSGEEKSDGSTAGSSRPRFIRKIVGEHGRGYLSSGMLTETVGDEDGIGGKGPARAGMERMGGSCEHDDP